MTKKMNPQTSEDVVKYSRAVSAEGAAIKNLVDLLKAHEELFEYEELPELVVRVMTDDDVQAMRAQQEAVDELMSH
jgi:thiamine pyrophosphate-dependent acetolactate synthase large subunit-like protein